MTAVTVNTDCVNFATKCGFSRTFSPTLNMGAMDLDISVALEGMATPITSKLETYRVFYSL